ncbi:MAG TPA: PAS domain-containing protein [Bacteroidota bacterium]|nr:PAS domain-containing protein [Bacteroidota bacterium]
MNTEWIQKFPASITVCDTQGVILEMNERSIEMFKEDGGEKLIGTNLLDCHPEPARTKLEEMLASGKENIYSVEKNGKKKFIYQSPWYNEEGTYAGFVEIVMPVPFEIPHFIRKS